MRDPEVCACGRVVHPLAINEWLDDKTRRRLVVAALGGHDKRRGRVKLERALRLNSKIHGFKGLADAPDRRKAQAADEFFERSCTGVTAILRSWEEARKSLRTTVARFLEEQGVATLPVGQDDLFQETWPVTHVRELAERYVAASPEDDLEEVTVMMGVVTGRLPVETEEPETAQEEQHALNDRSQEAEAQHEDTAAAPMSPPVDLFEDVLWRLRALPADAEVWEGLDDFLEALREIGEAKKLERTGRAQTEAILATMLSTHQDSLDYLEIDPTGWRVPVGGRHEVEAFRSWLERLEKLLLQHEEARAIEPRRRSESVARERTLRDLEEQIEHQVRALASARPHEESPASIPDPVPAVIPEPASAGPDDESPASIPDPIPAVIPELASAVPDDESPATIPDPIPAVIPEPAAEACTVHHDHAASEAAAAKRPREAAAERRQTDGLVAPLEPVEALVARLADAPDREPDLQLLLLGLAAEDDLASAYWLARSLEERGTTPAVSSGVLAALAASRWFPDDPLRARRWAQDVLRIVETERTGSRLEDGLVSTAVALRLALVAPASGVVPWLTHATVPTASRDLGRLRDLTQRILEFQKSNIAIEPGLLGEVVDVSEGEQERSRAARQVREWLATAPLRRNKFQRATEILHTAVRPSGPLWKVLQPVAGDTRVAAAQVRTRLAPWSTRQGLLDWIAETDRQFRHGRFRPTQGDALDQVARDLQEGVGLALHWCDLVDRERELAERGDWLSDQVRRLRDDLPPLVAGAEEALRAQTGLGTPAPLAAAAQCLMRSLEQIRRVMRIPSPARVGTDRGTPVLQRLAGTADSVDDALRLRLLWLPEVPVEDSLQPREGGLASLEEAIRHACAGRRDLPAAVDMRIEAQDFRFGALYEEALGDRWQTVGSQWRETLEGHRERLRTRRSEVLDEVEQAVVDGVIGESRAEYLGKVEELQVEETLLFPPAFEQLEGVHDRIQEERTSRLDHLHRVWHGVREKLGTQDLERTSPTIRQAFQAKDTRLLDEYLARITEALEDGRTVELRPPEAAERHPLNEFNTFALGEALRETLRRPGALERYTEVVRQRERIGDLDFSRISGTRLREALNALGAWRLLKSGRADDARNGSTLRVLLDFLGFNFAQDRPDAMTQLGRSRDWSHWQAKMSASDLARPIPQFGSQSHGQYDVLCLWDRPGADTIGACLRELKLDARNVIVLFLGGMSGTQRRSVARMCRERNLVMAVLDEILLFFLCGEPDARLPAFLRCTMAFTTANPYTPHQAGDVPPEMYFGRDEMARELQDPTGTCLVYGGRQLGKSALLRHVCRRFHKPEQQQYAWYEDIKLVGAPGAGQEPETLMLRLKDAFVRLGLMSGTSSERPETVAEAIRRTMKASPARRVLVMLDEADNFLDADAHRQFAAVTLLKNLMVDTHGRFKIVFAGLHNVQRFQNIPNQPLGHIGAPILVGPLEPQHARDLVRIPLQALGFEIDDSTVLRILSYTNYHPGLIQFFCQELLRQMRQQVGAAKGPPYLVRQDDVQAVYRIPDVRERIRERFDWTLALDRRYQAIAWAMIADQMSLRDSFSRQYSVPELSQQARAWWPAGFEDVRIDEMRGILEEMRGLGVLARSGSGYRLRSPNLVRLMGSESDIMDRLLELGELPRDVKYDEDSNHLPVDRRGNVFSPLTPAQERLLAPPGYGVTLVLASDALGGATLQQVLARLVQGSGDLNGSNPCIPSNLVDPKALEAWLERFDDETRKVERAVAWQVVDGHAQRLHERVRAAGGFCRKHQKSRKKSVRVLFLADAPAAWAWMQGHSAPRGATDGEATVICPHRWNAYGVQQRLQHHDMMNTTETVRRAMSVTGGWPLLLDELMERVGRHVDPNPVLEAMAREMDEPEAPLARRFRSALGLVEGSTAERLLRFLHPAGAVPEEYLELFLEDEGIAREDLAPHLEFLGCMGCLERRGGDGGELVLEVEPVVARVLGPS